MFYFQTDFISEDAKRVDLDSNNRVFVTNDIDWLSKLPL